MRGRGGKEGQHENEEQDLILTLFTDLLLA